MKAIMVLATALALSACSGNGSTMMTPGSTPPPGVPLSAGGTLSLDAGARQFNVLLDLGSQVPAGEYAIVASAIPPGVGTLVANFVASTFVAVQPSDLPVTAFTGLTVTPNAPAGSSFVASLTDTVTGQSQPVSVNGGAVPAFVLFSTVVAGRQYRFDVHD